MPNVFKHYKNREKMLIARNRLRKRNYAKTQGYATRSWTVHEIEMILNPDKLDTELSHELKRSVQSIQVKRCRVKK